MNAPPPYLVLCAVLVFVYATASGAAEYTGMSPGSADIRIELSDGLLTLATHEAPLHEVMREIGDRVGFKTILVGDFNEFPRLNLSFNNLPVQEAIESLVSDENRIILYAPAGDDTQRRVIKQVWLLQSGDGVVGDDESFVLGREKDIKGYKLARLIRMLQEGQDVLVRARAAIALGAFRDERAVLALESALLDRESSVRSQSINALGRIGNEQAAIALGNILLRGGEDVSERVLAARALWKHDSEIARDYLSIGANDTDEQVRSASSKPLSSQKVRATTQ